MPMADKLGTYIDENGMRGCEYNEFVIRIKMRNLQINRSGNIIGVKKKRSTVIGKRFTEPVVDKEAKKAATRWGDGLIAGDSGARRARGYARLLEAAPLAGAGFDELTVGCARLEDRLTLCNGREIPYQRELNKDSRRSAASRRCTDEEGNIDYMHSLASATRHHMLAMS
ncbi:hypothetical protein B0H17DRAFT_1128393 [Mycena rosella]|uniref:Uncharacterized protein n=1 Tax=Mycena rosella TaxID=1033263 RepID=A0AAD7GQW0_MYCRO|nr:hypothetical protein B0H17DRAFT_1128393 [Mycena rosella]